MIFHRSLADVQVSGDVLAGVSGQNVIQHLMLITDEHITFDDKVGKEDGIVNEHIVRLHIAMRNLLFGTFNGVTSVAHVSIG